MFPQCLGAHGFELCQQCIVDDKTMKPLHGLLSEVLRIRAPLFHLGPLLARSLQGFHSLLLRLLQGAQVFVQLFEHIRC